MVFHLQTQAVVLLPFKTGQARGQRGDLACQGHTAEHRRVWFSAHWTPGLACAVGSSGEMVEAAVRWERTSECVCEESPPPPSSQPIFHLPDLYFENFYWQIASDTRFSSLLPRKPTVSNVTTGITTVYPVGRDPTILKAISSPAHKVTCS